MYANSVTVAGNAAIDEAGTAEPLLGDLTVNPGQTLTITGATGATLGVGALNGSGIVTSSIAGNLTLAVGNTNDNGSFSGIIQNGSGTAALTKVGSGTQILSGNNTYSGGTTIAPARCKSATAAPAATWAPEALPTTARSSLTWGTTQPLANRSAAAVH